VPPNGISGKNQIGIAESRLKTGPVPSLRPAKQSARQRPWNILHACEWIRDVLSLVDGQLAAGMKPGVLTPAGYGPGATLERGGKRESGSPVSLLETWNHVRQWRKLLNDNAAETAFEIVHAHSFAAGMAAVRGSSGVVYQLKQTVEKQAIAAGHCGENSWLARSFRVAEQFVLTRAAAVVVSTHEQRLAALERGVHAENLFLIPAPVNSELFESSPDQEWLRKIGEVDRDVVLFLIPGLPEGEWHRRDAALRWMRVLSIVRHENPKVRFLFLADWKGANQIHQMALACNLSGWVKAFAPEMREQAMASADVVICDREHSEAGFALESMARGRALLAADVEPHREITNDGRGCLWFRPGEVSDIAHRANFLAGNAHFRKALSAAGREHCRATRSPEVVGAQYDPVYRMAHSRRKDRDTSNPNGQLVPIHVAS
jgi:glycosyltransferase involved in cell wall biosynthesis